jgi:phage terminase large subunit
MSTPNPDIQIPAKLSFLVEPARYKVVHGGRGSSKSWSIGRALLIQAAQKPLRVLCARELQVSIAESVHKLLSDQVERMGLAPWFEVEQQAIRSSVGSEFIFAGIRNNVAKLKSMEGVDIVWVEEAEKVSSASWEVLIPTIRKEGSEIWISFNPHDAKDPTYQRFVVNPPPGARVVAMNWSDNPWFPAELRAEMEYLYRVDPEAAAHVWGGACRAQSDAQVLRGKYLVEAFEPAEDWNGPYHGCDFGFSQDPTTLVKLWIGGTRLYIEHEAYGVGVDIDKTPALFDAVPGARDAVIRADSARPETISYLQRNGYPGITAVEKWAGSVDDGVAALRSFEQIIIHPRCRHAEEEARLYAFKTDRLTGDVLPELVDRHNHVIDAMRYALQPIIRQRGWGIMDFYRQMASQPAAEQTAQADGPGRTFQTTGWHMR